MSFNAYYTLGVAVDIFAILRISPRKARISTSFTLCSHQPFKYSPNRLQGNTNENVRYTI